MAEKEKKFAPKNDETRDLGTDSSRDIKARDKSEDIDTRQKPREVDLDLIKDKAEKRRKRS